MRIRRSFLFVCRRLVFTVLVPAARRRRSLSSPRRRRRHRSHRRLASEAPREIHYGFLFSGNRAGSASSRVEPDGTRVDTFEFNDRGRGSNTTSRYRLDAKGLPAFLETTGNDY